MSQSEVNDLELNGSDTKTKGNSKPPKDMNTSKSLDQILNELVTPWDTSDLPPNVRITSPSLKIAQAKQAIVEAVEGLKGASEKPQSGNKPSGKQVAKLIDAILDQNNVVRHCCGQPGCDDKEARKFLKELLT